MQTTAIATQHTKTHQRISKIVDGDGFFVQDLFTKEEIEVRLLGIDAPEIKKCRKLLQDERETRMPGQLLMQLGHAAKKYLSTLAPINISITLVQESQNTYDMYGRLLAYAILPDGSCINETLIKEGYAKPYNKYYCSALSCYQQLHLLAKQNNKGLYSLTPTF